MDPGAALPGENLGKYLYLLDAYDDLDKDLRKGSYKPKELRQRPDYEEEMHEIFALLLAKAAQSFEASALCGGHRFFAEHSFIPAFG